MSASVQIRLPRMHPGQQRIYDSSARMKTVACGRRYGKSLFAQIALTLEGVQGRICAYFAPTDKALTKFWSRMVAILLPLTIKKNEQKHILYLQGGAEIWFWSLENYETVRGGDYDFVVVDEACIVRKLREAWTEVIRPTLIDRRGRALFLSTPKGRDFFYELFQRGGNAEWPEWESFCAPTSANPHIPASEIAEIKKEIPELAFRQEILAEFLDADGAVFRNVTVCMTAQEQDKAKAGHEYVIGIDMGRHNDYTVCATYDLVTDEVVCLDRYTSVDFATQRTRIKALVERFDPNVVLIERNSIGEPNLEELQREGLPVRPFLTTAQSKPVLIDALSLALEQCAIGLFPDPVLQGELLAYEARKTPSGHIQYSAPSGQHDDCVIAIALALHAAHKCSAQPVEIESIW